MHLTVLGHLCKDIVHLPDTPFEQAPQSFGGIFYSVLTLSSLLSDADTVTPVFGVGAADYDEVMSLLKQHPNIDTDGIFRIKGKTNEVHLFYDEQRSGRIECSKEIALPIPYSRIKSHLDADGVLVNMVSGSDIALETLDLIRMEVRERRVPLQIDLHSLTLGIDAEHKRFRRPISDWRRWCFMLQTVQLSEEEAAGLTAERYEEAALINQLMSLMVTDLLITRGDRGATLVHQDIHKKLTRVDLPAVTAGPLKDATGCGDVFGAAFLAESVRTRDHERAFAYALTAAGVNASLASSGELRALKQLMTRHKAPTT